MNFKISYYVGKGRLRSEFITKQKMHPLKLRFGEVTKEWMVKSTSQNDSRMHELQIKHKPAVQACKDVFN